MISKNSTKIIHMTLLMFFVLHLIGTMKLTIADTACNRKFLKIVTDRCKENVTRRRRNVGDFLLGVSALTMGKLPLVNPESGHQLPAVNNTGYELPAINSTGYGLPAINTTGYELPAINTMGYGLPAINTTGYELPVARSKRVAHDKQFDDIIDYSLRVAFDKTMNDTRVDELYDQATKRYVRRSNECPHDARETLARKAAECCARRYDCHLPTVYTFC